MQPCLCKTKVQMPGGVKMMIQSQQLEGVQPPHVQDDGEEEEAVEASSTTASTTDTTTAVVAIAIATKAACRQSRAGAP